MRSICFGEFRLELDLKPQTSLQYPQNRDKKEKKEENFTDLLQHRWAHLKYSGENSKQKERECLADVELYSMIYPKEDASEYSAYNGGESW